MADHTREASAGLYFHHYGQAGGGVQRVEEGSGAQIAVQQRRQRVCPGGTGIGLYGEDCGRERRDWDLQSESQR